ncbi:FAD-binding oxidoreductase [Granulicella sp. dw_53]|uniref:FAD-binding oxidoreductase n=1 Tax=Granulicella sp. dw_53 TaxID=2719792 RepID=UPI001BD45CD3|nr:FAD-binding oxidoreductase [Granulicella sp. dw_53]
METVDARYLTDASGYTGWAERVFVPQTEAEVLEVLAEAVRTLTPLTLAGAGTGLTGARVPQGGWVLSLERFRKMEIEPGFARVGPAVTLMELRDTAARTEQFYAPDPTEMTASIGGTIATNASGSRSFRFGSTRRHLRALRVALMDGSVREFRRGELIDFEVPQMPVPATTKYTAGYRLEPGMEWVDLFCGSEGTLGVILEAEVGLLPTPKDLFSGVIFFASDEDALKAVERWRSVAELRMIEYADQRALEMLRVRYPEIPLEAAAALLIEAEGDDVDAWEARLEEARALIEASWFAVGAKDRERFRGFRHSLPELVIETLRRRGFMNMGTDYAVPIARNGEMLAYYRERLEAELPGRYVIYGHIGDAHLHVNMLPASQGDADVATGMLKEFATHAVKLGGTVSAEHGLGKRKAPLLELQYSPEEIGAMRRVKERLDPLGLLGRGTLFGGAVGTL